MGAIRDLNHRQAGPPSPPARAAIVGFAGFGNQTLFSLLTKLTQAGFVKGAKRGLVAVLVSGWRSRRTHTGWEHRPRGARDRAAGCRPSASPRCGRGLRARGGQGRAAP